MTIQQHASFDAEAAGLNATSNTNPAVSKMVKLWESKNAKRAVKASGATLMALSLSACGSDSDDTPYGESDISAAKVTALTTADGSTVYATVDAAVAAGVATVDITTDNAAAVTTALRDAAAELGVTGTSTMTNAELITAIKVANDTAIANGVDLTTDNAAAISAAVAAATSFDTLAELIAAYEAAANPSGPIVLGAEIATESGTAGDDTFSAVNSATSTTLTALDGIIGGAGTDTLNIADSALGAYVLPTSLTMTGVENIVLAHLSDGAADIITMDVTGYADVDSVSVVNAGTDINTVTVNASANVQTVTVSGGAGADIAAVTIADAGTVGSATAATTDALTTVSLEGMTGAATITSDALTSITVKNVGGLATNTDGYVAATDLRELTVSHNGGTNAGVVDAGATTVNFNVDAATTAAGTNTFAAATTLNVDVNAALTAGTIVAAAATDVNVNLDAAVTASTLTTAAATTMDFTGTANAVVTQTAAAAAVITNSGTGNLTLNTAIAAGQTYTGGAGVDTVTFAATGTTASTLGAGNDVATFSAVAGTGGSVDGGAGEDTVSLTAANAVTLSAAATFEADIANFEVVSIGAYADLNTGAGNTIALANLDSINSVVVAGSAAQTQAEALIISGFATGGTYEQTALLNTNANQSLTGSFTSSSDVMNITVTATNGFANVGSLTVAAVETINITTNDSDTTAATTMFDLNMDAANATTISVSGDAGITFANGTHANVVTMDASGVTAAGAAGVVTFTATTASNATITGGAGNDALTGGAANDIITGNAGTDALVGGAGTDTISGGDGVDTVTGGTGADTLTGGAGNDIFVFADADSTTAANDTVSDYSAGDVIRLVSTDNVAGASASGATVATTDVAVSAGGKVTFAAADDTLAEMLVALAADTTDIATNEVVFFEQGGNTYIFNNVGGTDDLIMLEGLTGLTTLTESTVTAGDFTIA